MGPWVLINVGWYNMHYRQFVQVEDETLRRLERKETSIVIQKIGHPLIVTNKHRSQKLLSVLDLDLHINLELIRSL